MRREFTNALGNEKGHPRRYIYIRVNMKLAIIVDITSIVMHRQICFVLSELISVARQYLPVAGIETRLTQTLSQSF